MEHPTETRELDSTMNMVMKLGVPLIVAAMVGLAATVIQQSNQLAAFGVVISNLPGQMDSLNERMEARDAAFESQALLREATLKVEVAKASAIASNLTARIERLERNDSQQWPRLRALGAGAELLRNELLEVCREQTRRSGATGGGARDCVIELPDPEFR